MTAPLSTEQQLRDALCAACQRLRELNACFNMARLVMNDKQSRDAAGELVKENNEFIQRTVPLLILKDLP